ncbi:MAG TPA: hypothetical protein VHO68_10150 [Bacteroidales bacterium]|nr:hypothetical protein [Bacteroidales bacterium]
MKKEEDVNVIETASLPEVNSTIPVDLSANFWRKLFVFTGPGFLIAVGYMDPGNWATDLAGGSRYGYTLLSVLGINPPSIPGIEGLERNSS